MPITYQSLCQRIKDRDFSWGDLANLMVKAAADGEEHLNDVDSEFLANPARIPMIKALRNISDLSLKEAKELADEAIKVACLPSSIRDQGVTQLQAKIYNGHYESSDNDYEAEAALDPDVVKFGVCRFHYGKVEYLALTPAYPLWVESINAAARLDLPVANALRVFYSSYLEAEGPCSEHGCYVVAFS